MKRLILLGLIGGALAIVASSFAHHRFCDCRLAESAECGDTGCWFRCEFGLDEKTCAAIAVLGEKFRTECDAHCLAVRDASSALDKLSADAVPEVRAAAKQHLDDAEKTCLEAREANARRIAALMPAKEGEHYLAYVLPRLAAHDHSCAPDASGR